MLKKYTNHLLISAIIIALIVVIYFYIQMKNAEKIKAEIAAQTFKIQSPVSPMQIRGTDNHGSGYYGASRGSRSHKGVDLVVVKNQTVFAAISGKISKLNQVYSDSTKWRGVTITGTGKFDGITAKAFYVTGTVSVGQEVNQGDKIGIAQDISEKYSGITKHVHFELEFSGIKQDPAQFLKN